VQLIKYGELPTINILLYGDLVMFGDNPEKRSRWLKLGRKQFVLRFGVLGWGVPTAILFSFARAYEEGWDQLPVLLVISLIMFPLAGILWGCGMWRWLERRASATATE
jgi:hypothetical protein